MSESILSGKNLCEKWEIAPFKLAELCHQQKIQAYNKTGEQKILASSACKREFISTGTTCFSLNIWEKGLFYAINVSTLDDFNYFFEVPSESARSNVSQKAESEPDNSNILTRQCLDIEKLKENGRVLSRMRTSVFHRHLIQFGDDTYIFFYRKLYLPIKKQDRENITYLKPLSQANKKFYFKNQDFQIYFTPKREGDYEFKYSLLRLDDYNKKCMQFKIKVKEVNDSFGNKKLILSEYNKELINIYNDLFMHRKSDIPTSEVYKNGYSEWDSYLSQEGFNYFRIDDDERKEQLIHSKDYFIFDYETYKKRICFLDSTEQSITSFVDNINSLYFSISDMEKLNKYNEECRKVKEDPRKYLISRCQQLLNVHCKKQEIRDECIKVFIKVCEGNTQAAAYKNMRKKEEEDGSSFAIIGSRRFNDFEKIARANKIPFVKVTMLKDKTKVGDEKLIKEILRQLKEYEKESEPLY